MKKFIIMGLIFAFGLASCGKSKKKCDEGEELKDGECVEEAKEEAKLAYITNTLASTAKVESGTSSIELAQNACVAVKEAAIAAVKVSVAGVVACDNSADANNKCLEAESYNIQAKAGSTTSENELVKVDQPSDVSTCKTLGAEVVEDEYTITNLADSSTAVTVHVGSQSVTLSAAVSGTAATDGTGCVKVKKSQVASLKIIGGNLTVCDSTSKCIDGNLEVVVAGVAVVAKETASANSNCTAVLK